MNDAWWIVVFAIGIVSLRGLEELSWRAARTRRGRERAAQNDAFCRMQEREYGSDYAQCREDWSAWER